MRGFQVVVFAASIAPAVVRLAHAGKTKARAPEAPASAQQHPRSNTLKDTRQPSKRAGDSR